MTEQQLTEDIISDITFSGTLPYALNSKEIGRQIKIATEYFYDNWRHALEPRYVLLPLKLFNDEKFKKFRTIVMPDCIQFVHEVKEIKGSGIFGTMDRDFADTKFIGSELLLTPYMGDSLMYRTVMWSFLDLTKSFIAETIAFDYNKNTKELIIKGRNPRLDVVIEVVKKIDVDKLYDDEIFKRYVRAVCRVRLGALLQTFDYTLPGGVKINYAITVEKAEKELEEIKAQMKGENTADFMFLVH